MITYEILNRYPAKRLKKEISMKNIKNYSILNKDALIKLMLKHNEKFEHLNPDKEKEDLKKSMDEKMAKIEKAKKKLNKLIKK